MAAFEQLADNEKHAILEQLVAYLLEERGLKGQVASDRPLEAQTTDEMWALFRGLVNTREPGDADPEFIGGQDRLLRALICEHGIATVEDATPSPLDERIRLWRGDITTLQVDGIVNAANSQMLGCWQPGHYCIDNAIHTYAGVQLRLECAKLMRAQGHEEPTGKAKVTSAWNLPSKHIIHTVGPIAGGRPTELHRAQLADCYQSCLDAAIEGGMHTIAFCCISTGVFGFPQQEAAEIAVTTVRTWLAAHPDAGTTVVFNVFGEKDELIYRRVLCMS